MSNSSASSNPVSILYGEFATRIIALHHFAQIRNLFPQSNWSNVVETVGGYADQVSVLLPMVSTEDERQKMITAKEHLTSILQLEILRTTHFIDVHCSTLKPGANCVSTCGCTDPTNSTCCCPDAALIGDKNFKIVWLDNMTVTAYNSDNESVPLDSIKSNNLVIFDIPGNKSITKLKIRLKWWEIWNTEEIAISDIT